MSERQYDESATVHARERGDARSEGRCNNDEHRAMSRVETSAAAETPTASAPTGDVGADNEVFDTTRRQGARECQGAESHAPPAMSERQHEGRNHQQHAHKGTVKGAQRESPRHE